MDGSIKSSEQATPPAPLNTPGDSPGGQAALKRRLVPDPDVRNRAITGGVLWGAAALFGAIQQFAPDGTNMPSGVYFAMLATAVTLALGCVFIGSRLPGRAFAIAEESVIAAGWLMTGALVAATGGANSPDLAIFANAMFYCAYFMAPRSAMRQVLIGTLAMWAPLAYDFQAIGGSGFIARATVMTSVLWAMALLIARNRHATQAVEVHARRLALTDPLTGVANLRTFEDELQRELAKAKAAGDRLGVAFVDVNGLKAANTVFGHSGGDRLLRGTAAALVACSSERDQVARVGGDEFAVLVPGADEAAMQSYASDFVAALNRASTEDGETRFEMSASVGTATFPADGSTLNELMVKADARMYDSKSALPPRLPTPETSGGRTLTDDQSEQSSRWVAFVTGSAPAAALAWLLGAALILVSLSLPGSDTAHLRLGMLLAAACVAIAGYLALAPLGHRQAAERVSNTLAVSITLPVIFATGGTTTPVLPLIYLVIAHATYALRPKAAAMRTAAVLGILAAILIASPTTDSLTRVMTIAAEGLLIACLLQFNRHRAERARAKALELSRTDALTKLANRRVFERALADAAASLDAESPTIPAGGLVLVDVDDFKAINTAGGHKSGDEVLRMIASVLDGAIGGEATVCRIGGDEFAGIFPAGDRSDLARAAAKCRAAIASVDWEVLCEPKVTVSIGCATWEYADAWKDIVVAADIALQTSKDAGKNAISSAPAPAPRLGPSAEQLRKRDSA